MHSTNLQKNISGNLPDLTKSELDKLKEKYRAADIVELMEKFKEEQKAKAIEKPEEWWKK